MKADGTDPQVTGKACYREALFLFAWGKGGYAEATQAALEGRPGGVLYDVKADVQATTYVFGLYARFCTIVSGRIGIP